MRKRDRERERERKRERERERERKGERVCERERKRERLPYSSPTFARFSADRQIEESPLRECRWNIEFLINLLCRERETDRERKRDR